jgi:hypothetical protein
VHQEIVAGAWCVPRRIEPGQPVGDGVHRLDEIAGEAETVEVIADTAGAQGHECRLQRRADVALRRLEQRHRLGEPRRCEVAPQQIKFGLQRLVGCPVGGGEELLVPSPGRVAIGTEEQITLARRR